MSRAGHILGLIAVVAAILFAVLAVISLGWLSPQGQSNFDARFLGYDVADAQAYLSVLPKEDKVLYLGLFRWIDTVFPLLAAVAIGGATWLNSSSRTMLWRMASLGIVAAYLILDLAENAFVAQMLRSDVPVTAGLVEKTSVITQLKWVFLAVSIAYLIVGWHRKRGEAL